RLGDLGLGRLGSRLGLHRARLLGGGAGLQAFVLRSGGLQLSLELLQRIFWVARVLHRPQSTLSYLFPGHCTTPPASSHSHSDPVSALECPPVSESTAWKSRATPGTRCACAARASLDNASSATKRRPGGGASGSAGRRPTARQADAAEVQASAAPWASSAL